jgi:hypothetical protein
MGTRSPYYSRCGEVGFLPFTRTLTIGLPDMTQDSIPASRATQRIDCSDALVCNQILVKRMLCVQCLRIADSTDVECRRGVGGINDIVRVRSFRSELSRVELRCAGPVREVHPKFRGNEANRLTPPIGPALAGSRQWRLTAFANS